MPIIPELAGGDELKARNVPTILVAKDKPIADSRAKKGNNFLKDI